MKSSINNISKRPVLKTSVFALLFLACFSGCATILNGTNQVIKIDSSPPGAKVLIDGDYKNTTPCEVEVSRSGKDLVLRFEKDGFVPFDYHLANGSSRYVGLNIFIGLIPGMLVDLATGGGYEFYPGDIDVELKRNYSVRKRRTRRR